MSGRGGRLIAATLVLAVTLVLAATLVLTVTAPLTLGAFGTSTSPVLRE